MIDLHCHILPGLDDGAANIDVSLRMAAQAADSGVQVICATPHCNTRSEPKNYRSAALSGAVSDFQRELDRWRIPIRVLPGAEVLVRGDFERLLEQGRFPTLNHSRYMLVEYYFDESPSLISRSLRAVRQAGCVPVVAHPERYYAVQERPYLAELWREEGCLLQLNKGSILGELGEACFNTASLMLHRHLAFALATDAHNHTTRNTDIIPMLAALERRFPEADPEQLLMRNPMKLINDEPVE